MRRASIGLGLLLSTGAAAGAALVSPVAQLAGRYDFAFDNGDVDGSTYRSENIVEVVPVDPRHAYVRFDLQFFNGHVCSLSAVAAAQGDALVYRENADIALGTEPCVLTIRRKGVDLTWNDSANGSCSAFCGARGGFANGEIPWRSKRPITYLKRLKASREYASAISEWRTGRRLDP